MDTSSMSASLGPAREDHLPFPDSVVLAVMTTAARAAMAQPQTSEMEATSGVKVDLVLASGLVPTGEAMSIWAITTRERGRTSAVVEKC
ncbi:hypothetical protein BMF94_6969 [Rhodotorula taiwanensis]|uniref:Uncharacterized protein n=1 Tax=Rhodotorula taiwanensis TaxID=741276 RepID=A0A2S5AZR9_9BASI|nr:hypothetical protein BMF94_6969 [Rhodotorula taiwanensis]